ncbi:class I SAM-dependent methyltransferase [Heliorestis acidaminivorans]|uniref:Class I SAM-dependent methyltransferase n=1 Tax=Heliorestis acidaminivorans TaxID=553427 RepID=A0A6I0EVA2_9FIRM|nr:class I SAM-dependent methyltransferase [Heliorestis acidaminivorans]KAB2951809.1 class I SAM-dependent methyltransferase [Heliorestis acidaminivorans]
MMKMKLISKLTPLVEQVALRSSWMFRLHKKYYEEVVSKEILLGRITKEDKVLCIGGGPLPCTALEIAQRTGARVDVIDCDRSAVYCARKFVEKLGLTSQIKIFCASGQHIDTSPYTVVHVALQAMPQDAILRNVWQGAQKGTRVLLRCPDDMRLSFFDQEKNPYCIACSITKQKKATLKKTILLLKGRERLDESATVCGRTVHSGFPALVGTYQ